MFWHELVLAGVGGRTIAEAKARLTYNEAQSWFLYMQERGTFSLGQRIDEMSATLGYMLAAVNGVKNKSVEDYLPDRSKPKRKDKKIDLKRKVGVNELAAVLGAKKWRGKK